MKKFLILTILLFACVTSTGRVALNNPGVLFAVYPYWAQWGYWANQYSNAFQPYGVSNDTRKNLLQGKILNDGKPMKGKKMFVGKVF